MKKYFAIDTDFLICRFMVLMGSICTFTLSKSPSINFQEQNEIHLQLIKLSYARPKEVITLAVIENGNCKINPTRVSWLGIVNQKPSTDNQRRHWIWFSVSLIERANWQAGLNQPPHKKLRRQKKKTVARWVREEQELICCQTEAVIINFFPAPTQCLPHKLPNLARNLFISLFQFVFLSPFLPITENIWTSPVIHSPGKNVDEDEERAVNTRKISLGPVQVISRDN